MFALKTSTSIFGQRLSIRFLLVNHFRTKNGSKTAVSNQSSESTNETTQKDHLKSEKDLSLIPQSAKDNFLIEFNKKIPTYDQLFEYQIDLKLYDRHRFINESKILTPDFKAKITKKYDLSWSEFRAYLRNKMNSAEINRQQYSVRRHGILGPDLSTSFFILRKGGRVRFKHQPDLWETDHKKLPKTFDKKYRLLSIDASQLNLIYEGMDNLILLYELEELNLAQNCKLDDWSCDKIARIFRNSQKLTYLNLSDIPLITHKGIECLHKINSLKTLVIKGTKAANFPFIELLVLMYNEINPGCKIIYK
ncbi:hypothetical protein SSS_08001 [Sarcoptes scabiei]|uniref:ATP synthase subunit s-like protein n=1 Tax=Sarcoptes scabiei TaxID=52283 RepID=A0A834VD05_SARSC|nr:hypothetical protein SSS_08001 [Sarcoptes scabiei]